MARSTDITSVTEHRQNLREHLELIKKTGRPLFVTANGETEAVVLSAQAYDELADRADLAETLAMIQRSSTDFKAGKGRDAREAIRGLAAKHGLSIQP